MARDQESVQRTFAFPSFATNPDPQDNPTRSTLVENLVAASEGRGKNRQGLGAVTGSGWTSPFGLSIFDNAPEGAGVSGFVVFPTQITGELIGMAGFVTPSGEDLGG